MEQTFIGHLSARHCARCRDTERHRRPCPARSSQSKGSETRTVGGSDISWCCRCGGGRGGGSRDAGCFGAALGGVQRGLRPRGAIGRGGAHRGGAHGGRGRRGCSGHGRGCTKWANTGPGDTRQARGLSWVLACASGHPGREEVPLEANQDEARPVVTWQERGRVDGAWGELGVVGGCLRAQVELERPP